MSEAKQFEPFLTGARIKALVGHYGSGKTELALNMAIRAHADGAETILVDMDIVNPFFRSAEHSEQLEEMGIKVLYPPYAKSGVDLPVVPAEFQMAFERTSARVILDIGGDDAGAKALGRYKPQIDRYGLDLYYVINVFRPFSKTEAEILDMMGRIAQGARVPIAGLINNSNLGAQTDAKTVMTGYHTIKAVSECSGVPLIATSGMRSVLKPLGHEIEPVFFIERMTVPEWME